MINNIRNFGIIAHIDHGKSTLADRMLELTGTIEKRKMHAQMLDSMELERERGITIKMQPVRMMYHPQALNPKSEIRNFEFDASDLEFANSGYILNLIDTPGHIDFSYEVSRALRAVEGVVLLVDATQGVEAQTLSVLAMAIEQKLVVIPALSKIDSPLARVSEIKAEIVSLLGCKEEEIIETSGKTGEGVETLLMEIIKKIPSPAEKNNEERLLKPEHSFPLQALVFDFKYSTHKGIIVFVRVMKGQVSSRENLIFRVAGQKFVALEVGIFKPAEESKESLKEGEIGYIVTGIKTPGIVSVGDTIGKEKENAPALSGKGFRCGFLGMLHLEIISERLKREFDLTLVITQPSITYNVWCKTNPSTSSGRKNSPNKMEKIYSPAFFPEDGLLEKIEEPWVNVHIITPTQYVGNLLPFLYEHEGEISSTESLGLAHSSQVGDGKTRILVFMPLRELMRGFFDKLKSLSQGYASFSYEEVGVREANVTKLSVLVGGQEEPALARVVSKRIVEKEAETIAEKLKNLLPRQMFELKIQTKSGGRIIASKTISAFRKDVTQHMYGGDITRKMKLREKQKKGKKKMKDKGKIKIPQDVFIKIMRPD